MGVKLFTSHHAAWVMTRRDQEGFLISHNYFYEQLF
jgi:hypothetical protein